MYFSLNDFAVSQVASGKMTEDQQKYLERSAGCQRIWDRDVSSLNYTGFLAPRFSNGEFNRSGYDPLYCDGCSWESVTYEGTPWGEYLSFLGSILMIIANRVKSIPSLYRMTWIH